MQSQPLINHPSLVYDGSAPLNEFLLKNPVIKAWAEVENFKNFSLRNSWGKEKVLVAEYKVDKNKIEKKDVCYFVWDAILKIKGTKA